MDEESVIQYIISSLAGVDVFDASGNRFFFFDPGGGMEPDRRFPFATLVIVGASNAVNLTDGLDGLAIGPIVTAGGAFAIIAYLTGNFKASEYLRIINVKGTGELTIFCGALVGAALGFLWFNSYPAQVFMGDVGSLALGGAIGTLAVLTKAELLQLVAGRDTCVSLVNSYDEMVASDHARERDLVRPSVDAPMQVLAPPFRIDGARPPETVGAPTQGQHTDEVLLEAGLSAERVAGLREAGVVGLRERS